MSKRKTKRRARFGDTPPVPEKDKARFFPGVTGDEKAKARNTTKVCTAVLNRLPVEIPGGKSKTEAATWCAANMKGTPFLNKVSSAAHEVCTKANGKLMKKAECWKALLAGAGETAVGIKLKLDRVVSSGETLVSETVKGRKLIPYTTKSKAPCRPAGDLKTMRDCHYELEFFNAEVAEKKNLPGPGPYLRLCPKQQGATGALFPVKSPQEAQRITDAHCECRKKGGSMEQCAVPGMRPDGFGRAGANRFKLFGYGKKR